MNGMVTAHAMMQKNTISYMTLIGYGKRGNYHRRESLYAYGIGCKNVRSG
jgi:hypothetical protein